MISSSGKRLFIVLPGDKRNGADLDASVAAGRGLGFGILELERVGVMPGGKFLANVVG